MWWAGLYFAQPPKPRKKLERASSDPMAQKPQKKLVSDLLSGPREAVPRGLGHKEDAFTGAATDSQLEETLFKLRKQSQSFRSDYMGTMTKPRDLEHLNELNSHHNAIARNKNKKTWDQRVGKYPVHGMPTVATFSGTDETPNFLTVMDKDRDFNDTIKRLYGQKMAKEGATTKQGKADSDFFKQQKVNKDETKARGKLNALLLEEPHAPSAVPASNVPTKGPQPPKETPQRKLLTKTLAEELLTDYYTDQQYFAQDHAPQHTQDTAARLFADFLEFGMFLFGTDSDGGHIRGFFERFYDEISFEQNPSLCTNEWITNLARLQKRARIDHDDPPAFAHRFESDLLDLFRLLMDQTGPNRGCVTHDRFVAMEPIAFFMADVLEQTKLQGSFHRGLEKARQLQTIRKTGMAEPDKSHEQGKRMTELFGMFREGKHAALVRAQTQKQEWVDDDRETKKELQAIAKAEAEKRAKEMEAEDDDGKSRMPVIKMKTRKFVHNTDGTVKVLEED